MKSAEEAVKEAKEKLEKKKEPEPEPLTKEEVKKIFKKQENKNVVVNITQVIKKATTQTAQSYKKNIDSVMGVLSYALFAACISEGFNIYNGAPDASILKALFDLFCAITLVIAKHRVKKGELSKFFDMTSDQNNKEINNFFVEEDDGSNDIVKF